MTNIFLKNEFETMFNSMTDSNISLPQWISIIDNANNTEKNTQVGGGPDSSEISTNKLRQLLTTETSDNYKQQNGGASFSATSSDSVQMQQNGGGAFSATSSEFIQTQQNGGGVFSATSSNFGFNHKQKGVNTNTETLNNNSVSKDFNKLVSMLATETDSATETVTLENQLKQMLNQNGGGSKTNVQDIKQFFMELKSQGVDVNVKLNDKTMTDFFDLAQNTTTEINSMVGGKGSNPGFQAFLDLKKYIAKELEISNGPKAGKITAAVQKEMKEQHSGLSAVEISKKGRDHFNKFKSKYQKMAK
jgi:hypothetical protein